MRSLILLLVLFPLASICQIDFQNGVTFDNFNSKVKILNQERISENRFKCRVKVLNRFDQGSDIQKGQILFFNRKDEKSRYFTVDTVFEYGTKTAKVALTSFEQVAITSLKTNATIFDPTENGLIYFSYMEGDELRLSKLNENIYRIDSLLTMFYNKNSIDSMSMNQDSLSVMQGERTVSTEIPSNEEDATIEESQVVNETGNINVVAPIIYVDLSNSGNIVIPEGLPNNTLLTFVNISSGVLTQVTISLESVIYSIVGVVPILTNSLKVIKLHKNPLNGNWYLL